MNHNFLCLCLTPLIFTFFQNAAFGQNTGINPRCKQVIDSTYNALLKEHNVVGASLAIVDHGKIVYANGYGFADREKKIPADTKTIYRIGSCSKSFTSLSILQLQEKGKVQLNQSVKAYLPELTISSRFKDSNTLFIRDMLSHVSGLPCDITNGFFCDDPPPISWEIQALNNQTTILPRRYKHAYSNVAFGLLGEVIARQSQQSYSDYLRDHIFKPLQMNSSFVNISNEYQSAFSKAYVNNKAINEPLIRDAGAGSVHSNVLDMANYLNMFLNRGEWQGQVILTPDNIAAMEENQIADVYLSSGESWGYGLYSKKLYCKQNADSVAVNLIGHGGDTFAFHADFAYIPELHIGAVILTNTDNGLRINSVARLLRIYVKHQNQKTLNLNVADTLAINNAKKFDTPCSDAERKGSYNFDHFMIEVKNAEKFKFKQGPALMICTRKKDDSASYQVKVRIFGFIPIPFKGPELKFVKRGNEVLMKTYNVFNKEEEYIGVKSTVTPALQAWKKILGKYEVTDEVFACNDCPYMNAEGLRMELKIKDNRLLMETKGKTSDLNSVYFMEVLSDTLAVSGGINRGDGETLRVLPDEQIYFSGFVFKKAP